MTPLISFYTKSSNFVYDRVRRLQDPDERGASLLEYGALIVLVAAIAAAVFATNIGQTIATNITNKVNEIFSGGGGGGGGGAG